LATTQCRTQQVTKSATTLSSLPGRSGKQISQATAALLLCAAECTTEQSAKTTAATAL
jgi:hypothetical protein